MYSVAQQQFFLRHYFCYYTGDIDGICGSLTKKAIEDFQRNHALSVDGIWGGDTNAKAVEITKIIQNAINAKLAPPKTITASLGIWLTEQGVDSYNANKILDYAQGILYKNALEVDGIFGETTKGAVMKVQKQSGIDVDGKVGLNTIEALGIKDPRTPDKVQDWSEWKYFERSEFVCQGGDCDGKTAEMSRKILVILTSIREHYNKPVNITSGVRCNHHNSEVGGVWNSRHAQGKAADFYVEGVSGNELVKLCYSLGCR